MSRSARSPSLDKRRYSISRRILSFGTTLHLIASRSVSLGPAGDKPSSHAIREAGLELASGSEWGTEHGLLMMPEEVGDGGMEEEYNSEGRDSHPRFAANIDSSSTSGSAPGNRNLKADSKSNKRDSR